VKADVADEITQYYKTPCPNGDHDADVMYNFWVNELDLYFLWLDSPSISGLQGRKRTV